MLQRSLASDGELAGLDDVVTDSTAALHLIVDSGILIPRILRIAILPNI